MEDGTFKMTSPPPSTYLTYVGGEDTPADGVSYVDGAPTGVWTDSGTAGPVAPDNCDGGCEETRWNSGLTPSRGGVRHQEGVLPASGNAVADGDGGGDGGPLTTPFGGDGGKLTGLFSRYSLLTNQLPSSPYASHVRCVPGASPGCFRFHGGFRGDHL